MFEEEIQLKKTADQIAAKMIAANVVQKKLYFDERVGKEYPNLVTEDAFDKKFIAIAVLGYPEQVGVWSYTLLIASQGEVQSPGDIASVLLQIPKIVFPGTHGQMPNKALGEIIEFYLQRLPS